MRRDRDIGAADVGKAIHKLGLLQIDSVNVLVRAHYMPLFSRLGVYDRRHLDGLIAAERKRFFEYWGHEASLLPVGHHPLLRWRMERARRGEGIWKQLQPFAGEQRAQADAMLDRIRAEGPLAASDIAGSRATKGMWVWSEAKHVLEFLFWAGLIAATHRRGSFERVYDLPERVIPRAILQQPTPDSRDAQRALLGSAAKSLGIATADELRDYYRIPAADTAGLIAQLVEEGTIRPVPVRGWREQTYLHRDAQLGRLIGGATLLSPFDPLIWHRRRAERLFDFRYRLEIYTPAHRREHGYYVLPLLLDGRLVARVDLKADRGAGTLIVQRAHLEPDAPAHTAEQLGVELHRMAAWLGLSSVTLSAVASVDPALAAIGAATPSAPAAPAPPCSPPAGR